MELALGCHYRICTEQSSLRFPEVFVGLIPGALGTQLLPRLASFDVCLKMCVKGVPLTATEALAEGVVDQVISTSSLGKDGTALEQVHKILVRFLDTVGPTLYPSPFRQSSALRVVTPLAACMESAGVLLKRLPPPERGGHTPRLCVESLLHCARNSRSFATGAVHEASIAAYVPTPHTHTHLS